MLLIASCDKPQSENKATSSSSVDTENGGAKPKPEVKPTNKAALIAEIKRATTAHGNEVDLNYIDTSVITNMSNVFASTAFNGDISKWDVSRVTDMRYMFQGATAFNQDISAWDVSQVTTMRGMFAGATAFNQDISEWKVSKVTNMETMFYDATVFNQDISAWKVSKVGDMSYMFFKATAFNQDISEWDVSQVTIMGSIFLDATAFNQNLESWGKKLHDTIKANNMRNAGNMFQNSGVAPVPAWCTGDCR